MVVHEPEVELRFGMVLRGGQTVPAQRFSVVLEYEDTSAHVVHEPEVELRFSVTLHGGLTGSVEIVLYQEHRNNS